MRHVRTLAMIADVAKSGSIRRTAERLNLTPSALTRRIQDFEHELGTEIFERVPHGMRLNAAGELVLRHIRDQMSDLERVRSQLADLSGVRRGHVAVACSQAFADHVLPDEVNAYRAQHPLVSFTVQVRDHSHGIDALIAYEVDLALVLQPPPAPEMHVMMSSEQPLCALMGADHPLAAQPGPVRLRDCFRYPVALPDRSLAIRHHLEAAAVRADLAWSIALESGSLELLRNYVRREHAVSFQIPSGIPADRRGLHARPIDGRDLAPVLIVLGHLRGRRLSIAAAKFADQIARRLHGHDTAGQAWSG
ncbi:LysR family transcriptional regulator [uncultured Enterovirga sp.]|uniref:LysR family transcriptional regulator n=1 Tax=uncultured Enterovirga sp. TaxID=2026352 RepID=UPI0035CB388C